MTPRMTKSYWIKKILLFLYKRQKISKSSAVDGFGIHSPSRIIHRAMEVLDGMLMETGPQETTDDIEALSDLIEQYESFDFPTPGPITAGSTDWIKYGF